MRKNPHVRICGGLGSATTLVYPTASRRRLHSSALGQSVIRDGSWCAQREASTFRTISGSEMLIKLRIYCA